MSRHLALSLLSALLTTTLAACSDDTASGGGDAGRDAVVTDLGDTADAATEGDLEPDQTGDANVGDDSPIQTEPYPPPDWIQDAVIYEIFVRQFSNEGTLAAIIPRLPELKALGVNTLWLMPIYPIGELNRKGTYGSPYAVRDYTAIDPAQGTDQDLRDLVAAVHDADMHIIFDWVANHTAFDHPWVTEHPNWYTQDDEGNVVHPPGTDWTDVADLNYERGAMRQAMTEALIYWIEAFDIDGYRCDVAELVPRDFWDDAIAELRLRKPLLMLAEGSTGRIHEAGFDLTYQWPEFETQRLVFRGLRDASDFIERIEAQLRTIPEGGMRIRFTTNHDETAWNGTPSTMFGGVQGAQTAFVLISSVTGLPLVYNGQEVGSEAATPLFEREPIVWDQNSDIRAFYEDFLNLYADSDALRRGDLTFPAADAEDIVLLERATESERLLVAVNVRDESASIELPDDWAETTFSDVETSDDVELGTTLELDAFEYLLLQ